MPLSRERPQMLIRESYAELMGRPAPPPSPNSSGSSSSMLTMNLGDNTAEQSPTDLLIWWGTERPLTPKTSIGISPSHVFCLTHNPWKQVVENRNKIHKHVYTQSHRYKDKHTTKNHYLILEILWIVFYYLNTVKERHQR